MSNDVYRYRRMRIRVQEVESGDVVLVAGKWRKTTTLEAPWQCATHVTGDPLGRIHYVNFNYSEHYWNTFVTVRRPQPKPRQKEAS